MDRSLAVEEADIVASEDDSSYLKSALFTVTRGTLVVLVGTIAFLALSLLWRILIVHLITVDEWGEMSIGLAIIALVTGLAPLGVQSSVARALSYEDPSESRSIVYSGLLVTSVSGIIFTVGLYLLAGEIASFFNNPDLTLVIQILSPLIFLGMITGTICALFQGFKNMVPYALFINILPNVFSISLALLLYYLGYGFFGILLSAMLNIVIVVAILLPYSVKRLKRHTAGLQRRNVSRKLIMFGLPLLVVSGLSTLMYYIDTLILGVFRSDVIVGYYTAGLTLGRVVAMGVSALSFIFLPVASQFHSMKRYSDLEKTYSMATKWSLITSVPLVAMFLLYPASTLGSVFGSDYKAASLVLGISAFGIFLTSLFGPAASTLIAFGRTRLLAMNSSIAVVANIIASLLLIPPFGMDGGALASALGFVMFSLMCLIEVTVLHKLHPFNRMYLKPLFISVIGAFVILLPLNLHPGLLGLGAIFLALIAFVVLCIVFTRSVDKTDVLLLEVAEGMVGRRFERIRSLGRLLMRKN